MIVQPYRLIEYPGPWEFRRYQTDFWDAMIETGPRKWFLRLVYAAKLWLKLGLMYGDFVYAVYEGLYGRARMLDYLESVQMSDLLDAAQDSAYRAFPQLRDHHRIDEVIVEIAGDMVIWDNTSPEISPQDATARPLC